MLVSFSRTLVTRSIIPFCSTVSDETQNISFLKPIQKYVHVELEENFLYDT